jgi:hypothetical protein
MEMMIKREKEEEIISNKVIDEDINMFEKSL